MIWTQNYGQNLVGGIVVTPILFIALMYNLLKPSNLVSWPLIFILTNWCRIQAWQYKMYIMSIDVKFWMLG
jgi:hypothetical protein